MSSKAPDEHIVLADRLEGNQYVIHRHHEDRVEVATAIVTPTPDGSGEWEQCPGSPGGNVYHRKHGGKQRGPAKVNSREYCEGYDRIFRNPKRNPQLN